MSDDDDGKLRAYLDGELAPEARVELEQELASSSGARRRLSEVTALDEELARLLAIDAPEIDPETAWARSTIPREQRPRSFAWVLALAAAVVLAVGLGVWRSRSHTPVADELVATQRETIAIGTRAKAVAEPGSALSWRVDERGDAHVRQTAGAVFYRVDAGDAFVVETPAGRVTVLGTCFTVEIRPMSKTLGHIGSAVGGAALASAVLLTVHEGKVALANERGELEVAAGQSARVFAEGGAPEIVERDAADIAASKPLGPSAYAALVRESSQQRQRLRALEAELAARDAAKAKGETAAE
jgi:ferric-dicitrate binding protein FerR (iron transport regulator)